MAHKTNAGRLLDQLGIRYDLREHEVDPDDLAAETVAAKIGLPPEQVFKTLVARSDCNGICMAVTPGNAERDLKALASASGDRKIQLAPAKELRSLAGYIRAGVTALAGKGDYPVCGRDGGTVLHHLHLSRNKRHADRALSHRYLKATGGTLAPLAQAK
jgi:Cys-tRNA(Pro)/Cys-tRNA(Cys) deacylase